MKRGLNKLFFSLILIVLLVGGASGQTNYALGGSANFNVLGSKTGAITWFDNAPDVNDNDLSTKVGFDFAAAGEPTPRWALYEIIVDFGQVASTINNISYQRYSYLWCTSGSFYDETYLWYNSQWNLINTESFSVGNVYWTDTEDINIEGPWNDVSRIKVEGRGECLDYGGSVYMIASHYLYELRAWGPDSCTPETDAEFCSRLGRNCGTVISEPDNCGISRTVDCGTCGGDETCQAGICAPIGSTCSDSDRIMKLSAPANAHGALWDPSQTTYSYDICYSDIYGVVYTGENPHECSGENEIVSLQNFNNAHVGVPESATQVKITLNGLIYDFGDNSEAECKFPFKLRSNTNIPIHIEIRDTDNNLVGGSRDITTNRLWGIGDVLVSNPVELVSGNTYKVFIDVDQARYFDDPFPVDNIFSDMHGDGGVDIGCGRNTDNTCYYGLGESYTHYYCGGNGATLPTYVYFDSCVGENRNINEVHTFSCGENGEFNSDGPYNVKAFIIYNRQSTYSSQPFPNERRQPWVGNGNYNLVSPNMGNFEFEFTAGEVVSKTDLMSATSSFGGGDLSVTIDSTAPATYPTPICYGDLVCALRDNVCDFGEEMVVSLYNDANSHLTDPNYDITNGLISRWKFEDNLNDEIDDSDNDGTFCSEADCTATPDYLGGIMGKSLLFESSENNYVNIADNPSLEPTQISVGAWFKGNPMTGTIVSKGSTSGADGYNGWVLRINGNNLQVVVYTGTNTETILTSSNTILNNEWNHGFFTYDGSILRLYLNGIETNIPLTGTIDYSGAFPDVRIGITYSNGFFFPANGEIDEVAIYNIALTPTEVRNLYNVGNYRKKVCCSSVILPPSDVYWADMQGNIITEDDSVEIGDTVLMVYNGIASTPDFEIKENDISEDITLFDDDIRTGGNAISSMSIDGVMAVARWTITQEDFDNGGGIIELYDNVQQEFYFKVNDLTSEILNVVTMGVNTPPTTQIDTPSDLEKYLMGARVNFEQTSRDPDDALRITWNLGEGDNKVFENCFEINSEIVCDTGNGDTSYNYPASGTKRVRLTAQEMTREQRSSDSVNVLVYEEGINIFPIISEPYENIVYDIRNVRIDASESYISKCSSVSENCDSDADLWNSNYGSTQTCYPVFDSIDWVVSPLYCFDYPTGGTLSGYDLYLEWTFDPDDPQYASTRSGYWNGNYNEVVESSKIFQENGYHKADLIMGYKFNE